MGFLITPFSQQILMVSLHERILGETILC